MIGNKDDKIVVGYSFPTPPEFVSEVVDNDVIKFQKAAAKKIAEMRRAERDTKVNLEIAKKNMMTLDDANARQKYLFNVYVPSLRRIGITVAKVGGALQPLWTDLTKIVKVSGWSPNVQELQGSVTYELTGKTVSFVVMKLLRGDAAYVIERVDTPRHIYRKRLDLVEDEVEFKMGPNEYVKDDRGVFTRRYGYAAKSYESCETLLGTGKLTGRFQMGLAAKTGLEPDVVSPYTVTKDMKKKMPTLPAVGDKMSREQMLFIHQEFGSGDEQRGVCLSSSRKDAFGNKGEPFLKEGESILVQVDLAMVPTGQDLLYNLYKQEAQMMTIGVPNMKKGDYSIADNCKEHTDTSTAKNREVYLRVLSTSQVVNLEEIENALLLRSAFGDMMSPY